ncbi:hypothetical protein HOD29_01300 [archaeon]|jgi:hypothetical protein|nr:hypothetical protein [archaeon]
MELKSLTSKLNKIPLDDWKRERPDRTIHYTTKIGDFQIKINILYPQHHLDDTKIDLEIYSPKREFLAGDLYNQEIRKIAMTLEKRYEENQSKIHLQKNKERNKELSKLNEFLKK